jgi:hypothetical protein
MTLTQVTAILGVFFVYQSTRDELGPRTTFEP